jgi:hypothetical protein
MPFDDYRPDAADLSRFRALCGDRRWTSRVTEIARRAEARSLAGRAAQRRHALELTLTRLADPDALAKASPADRHAAAFAREAVQLAAKLPAGPRKRLRDRIEAALTGDGTLIPLFHVLRTAAMQRARGFDVTFTGLTEETPWDLLLTRDGATAELACETVSAEEGREVHRGDWCALVDRVNPELQTWLAAHPGRYLLKMTLPEGMVSDIQVAELHRRISTLLAEQKRQDAGADAILKLDPLVLAGAQAASRLSAQLRAQFGEEAHLAVTSSPASGSVFVMAARAGRENSISAAACRRMGQAAETRLSGSRTGILAMLLDDLDRAEWRGLRDRMELEGATRRWMTEPSARHVAAVSCVSRYELFGVAPPDGVSEGELRFRNPGHPAAKSAALAPAILSSN